MTDAESLYSLSRFAFVGNGADRVRVCIAQTGQGPSVAPGPPTDGRRVLLLHGNPSHMDHWAHTVPALRGRAQVLAYDQPGLGRSDDFFDAKHSLERSAQTALSVLDHAGWSGPIDVIGQSHGGLIAVALAAGAPERVRSIVLLGTGGTPSHAMYRFFRLPGLDRLLFALGRAVGANKPGKGAPSDGVVAAAIRAVAWRSFWPDPVPSSVVAEALVAPPSILRTMVRLAHDRPCEKVAAYARRVRAPVIFLHARKDALVPISYARRLFEILRTNGGHAARFEELEGGHMVHFTRPGEVNPRIAEWLAA